MNADAFRQYYEYHFAEKRKIWYFVKQLTTEQFTQPMGYSHGSIRDQVIHLINVEEGWFSELQGIQPPDPQPADGADDDDRTAIRARWDSVETMMRGYLTGLQDEMLFTKPITDPEEDKELIVWQVLLHVVNHATDHRAQILRSMNDLGIESPPQDYIFFVYEQLENSNQDGTNA